MRRLLLMCVLAAPLGLPAEWSHVPPADLYQKLSLVERADLDKALAMYARGGDGRTRDQQLLFRNAANEWERFRTQHGQNAPQDFFAYTLFMQAMSQSAALDRHTAIRTFTEVLDLFPDRIWVAAPALYFRGRTYLVIGDEAKALADLREMTEDPAYSKNPLAADAFNRVAANHWQNKRTQDAVNLWEQVTENFDDNARDEVREAKNRLLDWRMVRGEFQVAWEDLTAREGKGSEEDRRLNAARKLFEWVQKETYGRWKDWYFKPILGDKRAEQAQSQLLADARAWFAGREADFTAAGRRWEYQMLRYEDLARYDEEALDDFVPNLIRVLRGMAAGDVRVARAKSLMKRLADSGRIDNALSLLDLLPDASERLWTEYELHTRRLAWDNALFTLDQIEAIKDADHSRRVLKERARIYHREVGKYEDAIKIYQEINEPPGTLWEITDCYRRWGKKDEAQNTLTEIASIFPDQAARAVFAKAEMFRSDGERAKAIGLYRNLLSHPEWRKSSEASKAHDRLEDMGIETGGAVIHEVH